MNKLTKIICCSVLILGLASFALTACTQQTVPSSNSADTSGTAPAASVPATQTAAVAGSSDVQSTAPVATALNTQDTGDTLICPKGRNHCEYPGKCHSYVDSNNDGYCDRSTP